MRPVFTARLAPRQSAFLLVPTAVAAFSVTAALAALASSARVLVSWCRDFFVAASAGSGAAGVALIAAVGALLCASLVRLLAFAVRESVAAARLSRAFASKTVPAPGRVRAALAATDGVSCAVVEDREPFALTVGLLSPRVVISSGLVSALTLAELRAVLAHEAHHAARRHPLLGLAWEAFRRALFFLPSLGDVSRHFALARELDADRAAIAVCGGPRALASALRKAVAPARFPYGVAAFGTLKSRIEALGGVRGTELRLSVPRASASVAFASSVSLALALVGAYPARASDAAPSCAAAESGPVMSAANFSPYLRVLVPQMSRAAAVQSEAARP